jgi:anaerobic ribonucleoside-triphosphate reductase
MILNPLFQNINFDIQVEKRQAVLKVKNAEQDFETTQTVIELINEWSMNSVVRRKFVKAMTNAQKKGIYRYSKDMEWIIRLDVYYVFEPY